MITLEKMPELDVRTEHEADLRVERTDISFQDLAADTVRVQVRVHNAGGQRSRPTPMRLESAPLGAFVPWQPLTELRVPALEPGEAHTLSADVARSAPVPLGDFNRVPPQRLLTAVNSPDEPAQPSGAGFLTRLNLLRRRQTVRPSGKDLASRATLARDLWDLVGRRQAYWAGNLNVFIGIQAVERHLARALRIYPGRMNLAMFMVGSPRTRDAYAFELVGLASDWETGLFDISSKRSLLINPSDAPIAERQWVESERGLIVMLATHPPVGCKTGNLEVHVTRRSCRKTAVVEFNLDPTALGAGCYSL